MFLYRARGWRWPFLAAALIFLANSYSRLYLAVHWPTDLIGGMFIGIIRSFWDGYFDSAWTDVVIFAILILTLVFRPTGIMGMRVPEK